MHNHPKKIKIIMTYKANGLTFSTYKQVQEYATKNNWLVADTEQIKYKGKKYCLCNLKNNY